MPRYQFHDLIATGGMGEVWRATDTALSRPVAIKLLKPEYADDEVSRRRFDSEARHAAALHHPHIAAVYDVGEMPTASGLLRPYLVMELVDGKPLSDLIHPDGSAVGRPLDPGVVRDLLGQAGDALAAAHRAGIVHRDIKPANLLVTADRQVKVTDFGIARAATTQPITSTGQVMGTPQYLSPEQARGEQATPASDVYSLGVVAFECLTGRRPFEKETPVATAIAHLYDPVPPLPASVPPDLAAVVSTALQKDPANRYPDAAAFTAALRGAPPARTGTPAAGMPVAPVLPPATSDPDATQAMPATALAPAIVPAAAAAAGATTVVPPLSPSAAQSGDTLDTRPWWKRLSPLNWALMVLAVLVIVAVIAVVRIVTHSGTSTAGTNAPAASTSVTTLTSPSASPSSTLFDLPTGCYAGSTVKKTMAALAKLGLVPSLEEVPSGGGASQTVADVTPCTGLTQGDSVTVQYYASSAQTPTQAPTPTQTPTQAPTPTPTPTTTATPTTIPTAQTSTDATTAPSSTSQKDTPHE